MNSREAFIRALFDHNALCIDADRRIQRITAALDLIGLEKLADDLRFITADIAASADAAVKAYGDAGAEERGEQNRFHGKILKTLIDKASA